MGFDFLQFFPLFLLFILTGMHRVRQVNCGMGLVYSQSVFEHDFLLVFSVGFQTNHGLKNLVSRNEIPVSFSDFLSLFLFLFDTLPFLQRTVNSVNLFLLVSQYSRTKLRKNTFYIVWLSYGSRNRERRKREREGKKKERKRGREKAKQDLNQTVCINDLAPILFDSFSLDSSFFLLLFTIVLKQIRRQSVEFVKLIVSIRHYFPRCKNHVTLQT